MFRMSAQSKSDRSLFSFVKKNIIPIGLLIASIAALGFFSFGFIAKLIYFADPKHQNQPLEYWMTPRYVVMSYELPPQVVDEIMDLRPKIDKRKPLKKVTEDLGITLDELQLLVDAAQKAHLQSLEKKRPLEREKPPKPKEVENPVKPETGSDSIDD